MKASRLSFDNFIDINARTGIITAKGKRMALMSVEALGLLRRDLINAFGIETAKNFIMRYGWACGYKDGETLESRNDWASRIELYRDAGYLIFDPSFEPVVWKIEDLVGKADMWVGSPLPPSFSIYGTPYREVNTPPIPMPNMQS